MKVSELLRKMPIVDFEKLEAIVSANTKARSLACDFINAATSPEDRRARKRLMFGVMYGATPGGTTDDGKTKT